MMKKFLLLLLSLCFYTGHVYTQNPITPPGVYLGDPVGRVWNDGKLYIYGSVDESCTHYCSRTYHVMETSDLITWTVHKNVFSSAGENDQVPESNALLFAPTAAQKADSFFLYFCMPDTNYSEGVASSDSPTGPFMNSQKIDLGGYNQIDPGIFIDDDGEVYYFWGQFSLKMAKMKPNMRQLDLNTITDSILTESEHYFHEGAFLAKRDGIYYLVYSDISRSGIPSSIGYATSENPFGPYTYGGVIIDNDYCNPGNWNNHGSIVEFNGQWYVLYHRSTHGCDKMRKACIEPIFFNPDGSIDEVEMTSQGASGPLDAKSRIQAEWACLIYGHARVEHDADGIDIISKPRNKDRIGYKYLDFTDGVKGVELRVRSGKDGGTLSIKPDRPWNREIIARVEIAGSKEDSDWKTIKLDAKSITGVRAVWFEFSSQGEDLFELDWFSFF